MRVVVSLTTIPERHILLEQNLRSLLQQTWVPDCIYLHVPPVTRRGKPYCLASIEDAVRRADPLGKTVRVHRVPADHGPITKLVPVLSLEPDPNTQLILVDDDVVYDPRMVARLLDPRHLHRRAVGFAGRDKKLLFQCNVHRDGTRIHFLETFAGVRYTRSLFSRTSDAFLEWVQLQWRRAPGSVNADDIVIGEWLHQVAHEPPYLLSFADNRMAVDAQDTPELRNSNLAGNNLDCWRRFHPELYRQGHKTLFFFIVFLLALVVLCLVLAPRPA